MGQKVNPHGIRLGIVKTWDAKWYADKDFADNLHEDIKIRDYLKQSLQAAGVSRVETERSKNRLKITIHTAKPGMVIGRGGSGIEQIKEGLKKYTEKKVDINIAAISLKSSSRIWMQRSLLRTLLSSSNAVLLSAVL